MHQKHPPAKVAFSNALFIVASPKAWVVTIRIAPRIKEVIFTMIITSFCLSLF
jgi:hypothetical protein